MSENKIQFLVTGSSDEPYEVVFMKDGEKISATCTCPAGIYGRYCKHRLNIIDGERTNIVSDNADEVEIIQTWVSGSQIESVLREIEFAEQRAALAKQEVSDAKTRLARIMQPS